MTLDIGTDKVLPEELAYCVQSEWKVSEKVVPDAGSRPHRKMPKPVGIVRDVAVHSTSSNAGEWVCRVVAPWASIVMGLVGNVVYVPSDSVESPIFQELDNRADSFL